MAEEDRFMRALGDVNRAQISRSPDTKNISDICGGGHPRVQPPPHL